MEVLGLIDVPWWIMGPFSLVFAFIGYCVYYQTSLKRRGIPGPTPAWLMGNMKDIIAEGMHMFDRKCSEKYGSYFSCYLGNYPIIMVCDPEMVHEIAITKFSNFYNRGDTIVVTNSWNKSVNNAKGSSWKYLRSIIQPAFSTLKMKSMSPIIRKSINELSTTLDEHVGQEIDMFERYSALTMDVICTSAFGIEVSSQTNKDDPFVRNAAKVLGGSLTNWVLMLHFIFPTHFIRNIVTRIAGDFIDKSAMEFLTQTVKKAIDMRLNHSSIEYNDLLKCMMDTQRNTGENSGVSVNKTFEEMKKEGMSEEDIVMNGIIFLAAGFDTTSTVLSWVTYNLALHPEYQERLYEEIKQRVGTKSREVTFDEIMNMEFLEMFIQETLRLYPAAARFNRQPTCDIEIKGLKLKKGDDITIGVHGIHRNPLYWPNPDIFDPERFSAENKPNIVPFSHIPFGAGPRNCVGMKLALVEVKMVIVHLLQRMRVVKSSKFKVPPSVDCQTGILRPVGGMWVKLERR